MEVCGGHTHPLHRFGVLDLLPGNVEMVHGPGCPVCVVPMGRIDALTIASREPGREVVFLGIGFETTEPSAARRPGGRPAPAYLLINSDRWRWRP